MADLDELVLLCRDERARSYIAEATSCYRSGAYKATIVATWIAVCYDIIDKLRELTLAGDKQAEQLISAMDKARADNDITRALKFERQLLEIARDKFELLSHLEYLDLDRLHEDRNRCAHPSLASDEEAFAPTAELARLHIRSAVTHLLQHPPVQGKYALDRLLREVASDYFPMENDDAVASLSSGPLKRPRESLVRNFVVVLLKHLFSGELERKARWRYMAALHAIFELHPQAFSNTVNQSLTVLVRAVPDGALNLVTDFLTQFRECWDAIEQDAKTRVENYVRDLPANQLEDLEALLQFPAFAEQARSRIHSTTREELVNTLFFSLPEPVGDRVVELYLNSRNFFEANEFAKYLGTYKTDLTESQQRNLLEGAAVNEQVLNSFELAGLVAALRETGKLSVDDFEDLLDANDLTRFKAQNDDQF